MRTVAGYIWSDYGTLAREVRDKDALRGPLHCLWQNCRYVKPLSLPQKTAKRTKQGLESAQKGAFLFTTTRAASFKRKGIDREFNMTSVQASSSGVYVVGRCSLCNGNVVKPLIHIQGPENNYQPARAWCQKCGAFETENSHLPVIPMRKN